MREICMSGSMSEVWRRSHGRTSEAPPNERGGNGYVQPTATAPHLDSTEPSHLVGSTRTIGLAGNRSLAHGRSRVARQPDRELTELANFTIDRDAAAVLL